MLHVTALRLLFTRESKRSFARGHGAMDIFVLNRGQKFDKLQRVSKPALLCEPARDVNRVLELWRRGYCVLQAAQSAGFGAEKHKFKISWRAPATIRFRFMRLVSIQTPDANFQATESTLQETGHNKPKENKNCVYGKNGSTSCKNLNYGCRKTRK